jgi:glycine dehydrogenase
MVEDRRTLDQLKQREDFISRHVGPRDEDIRAMLESLGLSTLDELTEKSIPQSIRCDDLTGLAEPHTEFEAAQQLSQIAAHNDLATSMIGMGYYGTITPPVLRRNIMENPGWYTAYTPYQPEISQGRLEALLNFQTMVADLTGMDIANASLLDEATAAVEAMLMCRRVGKSKSLSFYVSETCHPQTIAVMRTRAEPLDIELVVGKADDIDNHDVFGALVQYPDTFGQISDFSNLATSLHNKDALLVVASDLMALTLLRPPGEWGADIVVGSSQRFGVPMGFGGPHAAFFATHDGFKRSMPGRLVGVSIDTKGRQALRLALQTREQHIRREKATSNICTAQVLLAVIAGMYGVWHGPEGLTTIALRIHRLTTILADGLQKLGVEVVDKAYFDTLRVELPGTAVEAWDRAEQSGLNLRFIDEDHLGVSVDETTGAEEISLLWAIISDSEEIPSIGDIDRETSDRLPAGLRRNSGFMTHPVFHSHRSETEMMRYLHRLEQRDLALNTAMIPLGSCTMKLNAAAEMEAITWPAFAGLHPFAPLSQTEGFLHLIDDLSDMLCAVTGFDAISLQPNAGSQGELAGLLIIRKYHRSRGDNERNICLIPSSAHGTNPASAILAGMKVVIVDCDPDGNIEVGDLRKKAEESAANLAALMVTYPSTHGVYEDTIRDICDVIHDNGGQVYMDGANLNALVGVASPGAFGPDVAHLNLHKTFCIPHGGGGPGVGPVGVRAHLEPFLPSHPMQPSVGGDNPIGAIAAAPWGSAGILPISWAYIFLMGSEGLKRATQVAILNANYIARRLSTDFDILYTGKSGIVAHECIVDLRPLKDWASVDDVAKRLIDYGFHAPTMSFPVAGTLMIEPTESESKDEIDRFCDAMLAIRDEIRAVEQGKVDAKDNVLTNAPHTAEDLLASDWPHPYSREEAAYPSVSTRTAKYWPPVSRVDNVYGDRHVVCACPPLEAYREAAE